MYLIERKRKMTKDWVMIEGVNQTRLIKKYTEKYQSMPDIISRMRLAYQLFHDKGDVGGALRDALKSAGIPGGSEITYRELSRASRIPEERVTALERKIRQNPPKYVRPIQLDLL